MGYIPIGGHQYHIDELCGWAEARQPGTLQVALDQYASQFTSFYLDGERAVLPNRFMAWEAARKVLGKDWPNYPQQVGDCVSHSSKNAIQAIQLVPILNGERFEYEEVFPPYLYGCGRVFIGENRVRGDGSTGIWQAKAVMKYGVLRSDYPGVPPYSGELARLWGRNGPPANFVDEGDNHLVKTAAPVKTWRQAADAILAGYAVTVASNIGYTMEPARDGFHKRQGNWPHQMALIGFDEGEAGKFPPHFCMLNSWGPDVHGEVKDFRTGEKWPGGTLRISVSDAQVQIDADDSYAYSMFDGFPVQPIPKDLCYLW